MDIKFLGSAAYERIPSMFCNCPICTYARKKGGKDVRTQTQVLINQDLLIDFGMDNYAHMINNNVNPNLIRNILITHAHADHFTTEELTMRDDMAAKNIGQNDITIYGDVDSKTFFENSNTKKCSFVEIEKFKDYKVGNYTVTPLTALHGTTMPVTYLISDGKVTLYYCLDTGHPNKETYDFLVQKNVKIDAVICDCTYGVLDIEYDGHHMSLKDNISHRKELEKIGVLNENAKWFVTHFSHNGLNKNGKAVTHKQFKKLCKQNGFILAFDGLKTKI